MLGGTGESKFSYEISVLSGIGVMNVDQYSEWLHTGRIYPYCRLAEKYHRLN